MNNPRIREIKQAQRESFFFKEIANFFLQITSDNPQLQALYINRVKLSSDGGMCTIFFISPDGKDKYDELFNSLLPYKPSLRKAVSQVSHSRYTPNLIFKYDEGYEKQRKVDELIEKLKEKGKL